MRLVYEANRKAKFEKLQCTPLSGIPDIITPEDNDLYSNGDGRSGRAVARAALATKENCSYSFNPETWICKLCIRRPNHGRSPREVLILADQTYPATLASLGEKSCIRIIRLEFGSLADLATILIRYGKDKLPSASLVGMFSASHLATVGTAAYATNFANEVRRLRAVFGPNLTVAAAPPVLMNGTANPALIRSILELDGWLKTLPREEHPLHNAWSTAINIIRTTSSGPPLMPIHLRLQLPGNTTRQTTPRTFSSENWGNIGTEIKATREADELAVWYQMAADIRVNLAIEVEEIPATSRTALQGVAESSKNYLLVGNNSTSNLADKLSAPGCNVTKIWEKV